MNAQTEHKKQVWHGISHKLECNNKPVEILMLADFHLGDPTEQPELVQSLIDSVAKNKNRYCILGGDLMNTGIANSKSDIYKEKASPMEELQRCVELLKPIRNKILAIVPGNHEERISRHVGVDMTRILAAELDLEDVYSEDAALLFLRFGFNSGAGKGQLLYTIYVNHGRGGGRKPGGKINALAEYAQIIDADIFICGHTHLPASFKQMTYRINSSYSTAAPREQLFVNTASALDYGNYGKRQAYQPPSNSYPVITLDNNTHSATVTL